MISTGKELVKIGPNKWGMKETLRTTKLERSWEYTTQVENLAALKLLKNQETVLLNRIRAALGRTFANGSCPVPMGQSEGDLRWRRFHWCKYWEIEAVTLEIKENAERDDQRRNLPLTATRKTSAVPPEKTPLPKAGIGLLNAFAGTEPDVPQGQAFN